MNKLEKQLRTVIENDVDNLDKFIKRKLKNIFTRGKNSKELVELLPLIIENTNNNNCNWLISKPSIINGFDFKNKFIKNMDKFNFQDNYRLMYKINDLISRLYLEKPDRLEIIDKLLETNYQFDYDTFQEFVFKIVNYNANITKYLFDKYLVNEKSCYACLELHLYKGYQTIDKSLLIQNIDFILENTKDKDCYKLKRILKYSSVIDEDDKNVIKLKLQNKIDINKEEVVKESLEFLFKNFYDSEKINNSSDEESNKMQTILEIVYLIIEDVAKNEKIDISDILVLDCGLTSQALEVGNKVVKIGKKRITKTFPNNPYILSILLRKEFNINDDISLFIEVTEKVDTRKNVSNEELYQLYKNVRDLNLVWCDVGERNVGRLLKDNINYWHQELPVNDEVIGLQKYRGNKLLKKDELVILDNDCIFEETDLKYGDDTNIPYNLMSDIAREFELRYQKEKQIEKKQKKDFQNSNYNDSFNEVEENIWDNPAKKR